MIAKTNMSVDFAWGKACDAFGIPVSSVWAHLDGRILTHLVALQIGSRPGAWVERKASGLLVYLPKGPYKVRCMGEDYVDLQLSKHKGCGRSFDLHEHRQGMRQIIGHLVFDGPKLLGRGSSDIWEVVSQDQIRVTREQLYNSESGV